MKQGRAARLTRALTAALKTTNSNIKYTSSELKLELKSKKFRHEYDGENAEVDTLHEAYSRVQVPSPCPACRRFVISATGLYTADYSGFGTSSNSNKSTARGSNPGSTVRGAACVRERPTQIIRCVCKIFLATGRWGGGWPETIWGRLLPKLPVT